MSDEAAVIGRNLQRIRIDRNMSQDVFAKTVLGVHRTYLGGLERGERNLTLASLEKLAKKLGTTPDALRRTGDDEPPAEVPSHEVDETKWLERLQLAAQPRPGAGYVMVRWRDVGQALEALGERTKRSGPPKAKALVRKRHPSATDSTSRQSESTTERSEVAATIGRNIAAARKRRGWTQQEYADRLGIHRTYVGSLERGQENPSVTALTRYAEVLGLRITDLMHG